MAQTDDSIFLDVTRLISRVWTGRRSTGIDRVCEAYCDYFRSRARAVVQFRGIVRVLGENDSQRLFDMLLKPRNFTRTNIMRFAAGVLVRSPSKIAGQGRVYINTSHTDFDLQAHHNWVGSNDLRPVYFVHDLIPIKHPQLSSKRAVERHLGRILGALHSATGVIVNSRTTAADLAEFAKRHKLSMPPMLTAALAGQDLRNSASSEQVIEQNRCAPPALDRPYFVCVGTIESRKNYELLLQVWTRLEQRLGSSCPKLIIIGQLGPSSGPIMRSYRARPKLQQLVEFVTDSSDTEMGQLVAGSRALLMPTLAEGYGLPVIEALRIGTPVIASDIPSLREIGQGIPLFLEPSDGNEWEDAIATFVNLGSDRERQLGLLTEFIYPTWSAHFSSVDQWLNTLGRQITSPDKSLLDPCLNA